MERICALLLALIVSGFAIANTNFSPADGTKDSFSANHLEGDSTNFFPLLSINHPPFINVTADHNINFGYGIGEYAGGVSFADFNNDGFDDLTFASAFNEDVYFFLNLNGQFQQIPPLVDNEDETKQILWIDYDNDGDKDLFITGYAAPNRLYRNDGDFNLVDVTEESGLPIEYAQSFGAAFGDIDNDGWLDLFICNRDPSFHNRLYRNLGDGTFEDVTLTHGIGDMHKASLSVAFIDYNADGWQDIYIAEDKYNFRNTMYRNLGDGTFVDASVFSGADIAIDAMNIAWGDYDNDQDFDIYVTNTAQGNVLLRNNGSGIFMEATQEAGVGFYYIGWGANFFDYENDTDLDIYVCTDVPQNTFNPLYINNGEGVFAIDTLLADTTKSYANAIGDFDNDGRPDIAVNNSFPDRFSLWENNDTLNNNWIKIDLEGTVSNRDGIGSLIEVFIGDQKYIRYKVNGIAFLGQNSDTELIGLGNAAMIDSIAIHWLSGTIDRVYAIEANQKITIVETIPEVPPPPPPHQAYIDVRDSQNIYLSYSLYGFGGGVSLVDFNGDGWDDLSFASEEGEEPFFFLNNEGNYFPITSPVNNLEESKQLLWADIDNDGDQDLFITAYYGNNRLYRNNGDLMFEDITASAGLLLQNDPSYSASFGDIDNDGWLDLFVCNDHSAFPNYLYHNLGDNTFENITQSAGLGDEFYQSTAVVFFDFNKDGFQDIFISQLDSNSKNTLLQNNGDLTFTDVIDDTGTNIFIRTSNIALGFVNEDDDVDMYLANVTGGDVFFQNTGNGTYVTVSFETALQFDYESWGANFFDYENDGDLDLYICSTNSFDLPNPLYIRDENGVYSIDTLIADTLNSYSNAIGDFNNDGRPDIAVSNSFPDFSSLLLNNDTLENNWLKIDLEGTVSNKDGIGSLIEVYSGGQKSIRYTFNASSYLSQNSKTTLIGLGESTVVDSIYVYWLSGVVDKLFNVAVNQRITIVESEPTITTTSTLINENNYRIYPNPLKQNESIILETLLDQEKEMSIVVYDIFGQQLLKKEITIQKGKNTIPIEINLQAGCYIFKLLEKRSSAVKNIKFIVH